VVQIIKEKNPTRDFGNQDQRRVLIFVVAIIKYKNCGFWGFAKKSADLAPGEKF